jgi:hypothetical protein
VKYFAKADWTPSTSEKFELLPAKVVNNQQGALLTLARCCMVIGVGNLTGLHWSVHNCGTVSRRQDSLLAVLTLPPLLRNRFFPADLAKYCVSITLDGNIVVAWWAGGASGSTDQQFRKLAPERQGVYHLTPPYHSNTST